jgi:NADP-reducing hydrogenase subunit HndB
MKSLAELKKIREEAASKINLRDKKDGFRIVVGMATCGITAGARPVLAAFVDQVAAKNLNNVTVTQVGCLGECALEPVVEVFDAQGNRTTYAKVSVADVEVILDKHVIGGNVVTEKTLDVIKAAK